MDPRNYRMSLSNRMLGPENERIVFYADDMDYYHERLPDFRQELMSHGLYPPSPRNRPRRSNSVCSQSDRPRRFRNAEAGHRRRNSVHGTRSRTNSCSRPTPLGDGRRASVSKKLQNRRPSTVGTQRKNSVRQTKLDDSKKKGQIAVKSPMELEQARKYRRTIFIVLGIFIFLIVASILVIVVTLTNNSFHIPPINNQELTKHQTFDLNNKTFRKENEELLNTLNQDTTVLQNSTVPP